MDGLRLARLINARRPDSQLHGRVPYTQLTIQMPSELRSAIDAELRRTAERTGLPVEHIHLNAVICDTLNDGLAAKLSTIASDGSC